MTHSKHVDSTVSVLSMMDPACFSSAQSNFLVVMMLLAIQRQTGGNLALLNQEKHNNFLLVLKEILGKEALDQLVAAIHKNEVLKAQILLLEQESLKKSELEKRILEYSEQMLAQIQAEKFDLYQARQQANSMVFERFNIAKDTYQQWSGSPEVQQAVKQVSAILVQDVQFQADFRAVVALLNPVEAVIDREVSPEQLKPLVQHVMTRPAQKAFHQMQLGKMVVQELPLDNNHPGNPQQVKAPSLTPQQERQEALAKHLYDGDIAKVTNLDVAHAFHTALLVISAARAFQGAIESEDNIRPSQIAKLRSRAAQACIQGIERQCTKALEQPILKQGEAICMESIVNAQEEIRAKWHKTANVRPF